MPAKIYYTSLNSADHWNDTIRFEQLTPDTEGHWLEPNNADFAHFLPLLKQQVLPEAPLPYLFHASKKVVESSQTTYPLQNAPNISPENSQLCIQSVLAKQLFCWLVPADTSCDTWGKHLHYFPFMIDLGNGIQENITDDALHFFRKHHHAIVKKMASQASEHDFVLKLKELTQSVIRDSKNLPVLHKFSLQLFDLISRVEREKIATPNIDVIRRTLQRYQEKVTQLKPHAQERKSLFERVSEALKQFEDTLLQIETQRKSWQELQENMLNISKENIFYYLYAVLHHPEYQNRYAADLRRGLPRLPLYTDFFLWVGFGEALAQIHLQLNTIISPYLESFFEEPFPEKWNIKLLKETQILEVNGQAVPLPTLLWEPFFNDKTLAEWLVKLLKSLQKQGRLTWQVLLRHVDQYVAYAKSIEEVLQKMESELTP